VEGSSSSAGDKKMCLVAFRFLDTPGQDRSNMDNFIRHMIQASAHKIG